MSEVPTPPSSLNPDEQDKLRELTAQSWNLELVISGAALFATLQIPDLLNSLFDYFQYNLMSHTEGMLGTFQVLVFSMIKATCYVLFVAFLTNFVMRALWVGLVGLLAVFPMGVQYDQLPMSTPAARKRMANELGPLERYILRLDRRCNIVFGVAFLFVIYLVMVATFYLFILLIYAALQLFVPATVLYVLKIAGFIFLCFVGLTSLLMMVKPIREHPIGEKVYNVYLSTGKTDFTGMYKPYMFIANTFSSNLPRKQFVRAAISLMIAFFLVLIIELSADMGRMKGVSLFNQRHLFSVRIDSLMTDPTRYDNQRAVDALVGTASIQADVIREPYVRLFVAYPKALDTLLTQLAKEPVWNDTLLREEQRNRRAVWSHTQLSQLLQIRVNDSLYQQPGLVFTRLGEQQQHGWQTVLLPSNLKTGKNLIRVSIQADKHTDDLATIPFWYVPEP